MNKLENLIPLIGFILISIAMIFVTSLSFAAEAEVAKDVVKYVDPNPWTHKTQRLDRDQLDKLLGHPEKILFVDVRRPDELTKLGGFPVYLSVQSQNLQESLDYIPKGRRIITISNRAHRAGDAGDFLISKGYKVAGAVGVLDYQDAGGTLSKIAVPPPKVVATASTAASSVADTSSKK
jgi:rhodanese-related sulfurtransferase